jgi:hypothetical protein
MTAWTTPTARRRRIVRNDDVIAGLRAAGVSLGWERRDDYLHDRLKRVRKLR